MSTEPVRCAQCGAPLAPADAACASCGAEVDPASRAALMGPRAEAYAASGAFDAAVRAAGVVLGLPIDASARKVWLRKRAAWAQRTGREGDLERAAADLKEAVVLDDGDPLGHQLRMDLLQRLGRLDEVRAEYAARLERDPEDAVARQHLGALKLMNDLRTAPPPKLDLPPEGNGLFIRMLRPTPSKMVAAGFGALSCLAVLIGGWGHKAAGGSAAALGNQVGGLGPLVQALADPWLNALQAVAYSAYLVWGLRRRG